LCGSFIIVLRALGRGYLLLLFFLWRSLWLRGREFPRTGGTRSRTGRRRGRVFGSEETQRHGLLLCFLGLRIFTSRTVFLGFLFSLKLPTPVCFQVSIKSIVPVFLLSELLYGILGIFVRFEKDNSRITSLANNLTLLHTAIV
jgi:hypothetical protein